MFLISIRIFLSVSKSGRDNKVFFEFCSCRLTWSPVDSDDWFRLRLSPLEYALLLVVGGFTCRDKGRPYGRSHSDAQVNKGLSKNKK